MKRNRKKNNRRLEKYYILREIRVWTSILSHASTMTKRKKKSIKSSNVNSRNIMGVITLIDSQSHS